MSAIEFVARSSAGSIQRGFVGGANGADAIVATAGSDISLNLARPQIVGYAREGNALHITLFDGRVVVIEGYFGPDGQPVAELFVSSDGYLAQVTLAQGMGGTYYANYVDQTTDDKWTPDDELYFVAAAEGQVASAGDDAVGMLAGFPLAGGLALPLLGLIGLGAGTAVLGDDEVRPPTGTILAGTKDVGHVVNAEDHADGVTISGAGTKGATVNVVINETTHTTIINESGTWTVTFPPGQILTGTYETPVVVTFTKDGKSLVINDVLVVDTVVSLTFDADSVGGDGMVNAAEQDGVVTLTGTVEAGATVTVIVNSVTYTAVVTGTNWSLALPAGVLPEGVLTQSVTVTAVDVNENTITINGSFQIDTETAVTINTAAIGGNNVVNAVEHAGGVLINGTAEAGASVVVTVGSVSHTVTATAGGTWSATFATTEIAEGTYTATVTAVSTDAAGNTATATGTFIVDTEIALTFDEDAVGGDGVVNAAEQAGIVTLTGTVAAGSAVTVVINGTSYAATVTGEAWSLALPAGVLPTGERSQSVSVSAVDAVGNAESITGSFDIDTVTSVTINTGVIGGNGTVNGTEHAGGTAITGSAQAGASVVVTVGTVSHTVTASAAGLWSATFGAAELPTGTYQASVTAVATDIAGNTASATGTFQVDTETSVTVETATVETDGVVNFVERADGVILTGTAEAGASVVVTFAGVSHTVTASNAGVWSASFAAAGIPTGELLANVTAVATDLAGNTATATGNVTIDTFVNRLEITSGPVGGDDVVNLLESQAAITVTGMVEVGSAVSVVLAGVTRPATVAADGAWTVTYPAGSLPAGEYATQLIVNATDAAGNTASVSENVTIDTVVGDVALSPLPIEIDDIVNFVERSDGVLIHGTATPGLTVTVTLGAAVHQVVAAPNGTWSSLFLASEIPQGTYMAPITASITDSAGNFKEVSDQVRIDTEVVPFTLTTPIEGDDIVSAAEEADGVIISGTVEAGSTVAVTFAGATRTVVAGADGAWSAQFAASQIPDGQYDTSITATATDLAGNTRDLSHDARIDTIVDPLTMNVVEGDDLVNREEALDGIVLSGTVEVGSTVMVTFEGITRAATVVGGAWSVNFSADEVPAGEYVANVSILATDAVGNTRVLDETFEVDTSPPEAPLIESYTRAGEGVRGLSTTLTDDDIETHQVNGVGAVTAVNHTVVVNTTFNEIDFDFASPTPNGSHLVMTATDASGNATSTLFVLEEPLTNAVNPLNAGLDRFNIEAIDLQFAEDSVLTLTAADLESLCAHSNTLTIHGGLDDTVNILGATATGTSQVIEGRIYDVYSLGANGGSLIIDEAITVHT